MWTLVDVQHLGCCRISYPFVTLSFLSFKLIFSSFLDFFCFLVKFSNVKIAGSVVICACEVCWFCLIDMNVVVIYEIDLRCMFRGDYLSRNV